MHDRVMSARVAFALAVTCLVTFVANLTGAAPLMVRIDPVDFTACPKLKLFVAVEDGAGKAVRGLLPSAFSVKVAGQVAGKVQVKPFEKSGEGLAVALVLDVSGSMSGVPMDSQNRAASAFIAGLRSGDRVSVVTFGNTVRVVRAFTKPADDIRRQVESLAADATPTTSKLYDGIYRALENVRDAELLPGRRAVVVISDGKDVGSTVTLEDCIRLASAAGCSVHTIGFSRLGGSRRPAFLASLARLSQVSGGTHQEAPDPASLSGLYQALSKRLMNRYVLRLTARGIRPDGKPREVRVVVATPTGRVPRVRGFTVPRNHRCPPPPAPPPPPPPPPPPRPVYKNPVVLGCAAAGVLLVLTSVILLVRRARRRAEDARRCQRCGEALSEDTDDCPHCDSQAPIIPLVDSSPEEEPIAQLVTLSGGKGTKGDAHNITSDICYIGRDTERCQILLDDKQVSTVHAIIRLRAGTFEVQDHESANGTVLNGHQVKKSELHDGDELELGSTRFRFIDRRS